MPKSKTSKSTTTTPKRQRGRPFDERKWNAKFVELQQYKKVNGHCHVPQRHQLGRWTTNQRQSYKNGKLSTYCIERLESIGFQLGSSQQNRGRPFDEDKWNEKFEELQQYKKENGHCHVPQRHKLGQWVTNQRLSYKKGKLSTYCIERLESLGLHLGSCQKNTWEINFLHLQQYKEENGDCNVPQKSYGSLGVWVNNQRIAYKNNNLTEERIKRLEDIGFQWKLRK